MADFALQDDVLDWLAVLEPGCPMCEDVSTVLAAIDVVIDGDQLGPACLDCGRLVRQFSWHDDDGLPECYLGRFDSTGAASVVVAVYEAGGAVRHVPTVDTANPNRHCWPHTCSRIELARAILAHLVGLDVLPRIWEEFDTDIISTLAINADGEWELLVDDVIEWLAANR